MAAEKEGVGPRGGKRRERGNRLGWWFVPVRLVLRKRRQDNQKFKSSLSYTVHLRPA